MRTKTFETRLELNSNFENYDIEFKKYFKIDFIQPSVCIELYSSESYPKGWGLSGVYLSLFILFAHCRMRKLQQMHQF